MPIDTLAELAKINPKQNRNCRDRNDFTELTNTG